MFKILTLGDIFGHSGRKLMETQVSSIKEQLGADMVIANIENASGATA